MRILLFIGLGLLNLATAYPVTAEITTNSWPNHVIDAYDHPCQHNQDGFDGAEDCGDCDAGGLVRWRVSEPYLSLWLHDKPISYFPSQGSPIAWELTYKQRSTYSGQVISSFGTNWGCDWFGYVEDNINGTLNYCSHGAKIPFQLNASMNYKIGVSNQELWTLVSGHHVRLGVRIQFADGSYNDYRHGIGQVPVLWLLSLSIDRHGFTTQFLYNTSGDRVVRQVLDCDGKTNFLSYAHTITNLVTSIQDPYGRIAQFQYDTAGQLTNIIDVATNSSAIAYDISGLVTNLTTPYGSTSFKVTQSAPFQDPNNTNRWVALGGTNIINRSVEVTEANASKQLYLYRDDARNLNATSSVVLLPASFPLPSTGVFSNTFENSDLFYRNSFHWNRQQYGALSASGKADYSNLSTNDYQAARMKHWFSVVSTNGETLSDTLSMLRASSPDGYATGQMTWYDYEGQTDGHHEGTNSYYRFVARILPDGGSWFARYDRAGGSNPTNIISTYSVGANLYLRTNGVAFTDGSDLFQFSIFEGTNANILLRAAYSQDGGNRLLQWTNAVGEIITNKFDSPQSPARLTNILRASGLGTKLFYYTSGNYNKWLRQIVDYSGTFTDGASSNRVRSFTYTNGLIYTYTDPRGLSITNTWDPLQRLTGVTLPDGTYFSNRYDKLDLSASRDRLGNWTYFGHDALRRLIAVTNANGVVTRYGYCDCGSLGSVTNAWNTPAEMVTSFAYDLQGNRTYIYYPDATVTNSYDALGRLSMTSDGQSYRLLLYNNQSLITNISDSLGTEQALVYDHRDRPTNIVTASGVTITNLFDNLDRLLARGYPDGGIEKLGYSARGLIAYTNQMNQPTLYGRDAFGRVTTVTNANQETQSYTYDPAGDLLTLTDGKAQVTTWNDDEYGRVTNKLDQAGTEVLRFKYDPNSRLTNRWSVAKGDTKYKYDPIGNLTNIDYAASTDVSFAYDALNRLTNMVDEVGTTKFAYTAAGRLWTEDGPFASDTVTNDYLNRLRTSLSLAQLTGIWTNGFAYDAARRLTNVTSAAGTFDYTYSWASPRPLKIALPNTSYITNTYDSVARLTGTWLKKSDNTTLDSYAYVYNPASQRTNLTYIDGSTVVYKYDAIGQLTVADSSVSGADLGYTYDAAWNLNYRTNNGSSRTFTVDTKNELTNAFSGAYAYDGNGNLTSGAGGTNLYMYDGENRLVQWYYYQAGSAGTDGDRATEFFYDGFGRLRERDEYYWQNATAPGLPNPWTLTNTTRYVYDVWRVIQERNGSDSPQVSYTRGNDLSGSLEGGGGIGGLLGRTASGSSTFYHADGSGNITYLVDGGQAQAGRYAYDPFGKTTTIAGTLGTANVYRFSSKEVHTGSGLYYYGARFYDPNLQRWLNRDPIGEVGGINLYGFVGNRPVSFVDPLGMEITYYYGQDPLGGLNPAGQVPYLRGDNVGENLGAGFYNMIPFVNNSATSALDVLGQAFQGLSDLASGIVRWLGGSPADQDLAARTVGAATLLIGGPEGKMGKGSCAAEGGASRLNIFGTGEAPGFVDVSSNARFANGRQLTSGFGNGSASDIFIRNAPITGENTIPEILRLSQPGTRVTLMQPASGFQGQALIDAFGSRATVDFMRTFQSQTVAPGVDMTILRMTVGGH